MRSIADIQATSRYQTREAALFQQRLRVDHIDAFSTPEGRRVLRNLIMSSNFLETTIANGKPDAATYTREAAKWQIYRLIKLVPGLVGDVLYEILQEWESNLQTDLHKELSDG